MAKLINGADIKYTCIAIDEETYNRAISDVLPTDVYGFVVDGVFQSSEDLSLKIKNDWSLPIIKSYRSKYWVVIENHPGDVYRAMSEITQQDIYRVVSYDVWQGDKGLVAVATEVDED